MAGSIRARSLGACPEEGHFNAAYANELQRYVAKVEERGWGGDYIGRDAQNAVETRVLRRAGKVVWDTLAVEAGEWIGTSNRYQAERGLHDYKRVVKFKRALTWGELRAVEQALHIGYPDRCPGWTGAHGRVENGTAYAFRTTMDSSG